MKYFDRFAKGKKFCVTFLVAIQVGSVCVRAESVVNFFLIVIREGEGEGPYFAFREKKKSRCCGQLAAALADHYYRLTSG